MSESTVRIRVLFADSGTFHREELSVAASSLHAHPRLIDSLREDPEVVRKIHLDVNRLCAAWVVEEA